MRLIRHTDPAAFYAHVEPFLSAHEAENCLLIGITNTLMANGFIYNGDRTTAPYFAVVEGDDGAVIAAAVRTPPRYTILSYTHDRDAVRLIADDQFHDTPDLPGTSGITDAAHAFAQRWTERSGLAHTVEVHERIYRCDAVIPPRTTPGALRLITPDDRAVCTAWMHAFELEAFGEAVLTPDRLDKWFTDALDAPYRALYVWEDDGRAVSMVGTGGPTPNGMRIGPVYTPPEARGRGYASAATAATTALIHASGRRLAFLFTDLANPISNSIYQQIGYRPVIDFDMLYFGE